MGCRAPQTLQPERGLRRPAGGRRRRGRPGCPDTGHAVRRSVRRRCPLCGQTSVQRAGRTSGVHTTGVHDRCDAGVRTDRRPVSAALAAALSAPRWILEGVGAAGPATLAHRVRRVAVVGEVSGLVVAARIGPGGEGMVVRRAARGWHEWRRQTWAAALHAQRLGRRACRLGDQGSWSSARCRSGGRGSTGRSRYAHVAPPVRPGQVAGVMPDMGLDRGGNDHASWSLRWCWSRVVRLWRAHPVRRGAACGRSAAAVCQERCPLGADSALTCENSGGRDRV
jgi:hypothetical protein